MYLPFSWYWPESSDNFQKRGSSRKWGNCFWNMGYRYLCTLVLEAEEISCRACLLFVTFLVTKKKKLLKDLLNELHFHPFIIKFFWFSYLQFNIKEKIRIKAVMLLMCLEVLGERLFCFPGRVYEGVCRKPLSLVKLY